MRLHEQVKHQALIIQQLKANIETIQSYCESSKFNGLAPDAKMVNRDDILLRINEGHRDLQDIEDQT